MICQHPVREFTSIGECPRCGHIATHYMEVPGDPADEDPHYKEPGELVQIFAYGGRAPQKVHDLRLGYSTNWDTCEVVRECVKCEVKWGER